MVAGLRPKTLRIMGILSRRSESFNLQRRPLIMPHEITQQMRKNEQIIIIVQGHDPIRCGRAIYFRRKDMDAEASPNRFVKTAG